MIHTPRAFNGVPQNNIFVWGTPYLRTTDGSSRIRAAAYMYVEGQLQDDDGALTRLRGGPYFSTRMGGERRLR